MPKEVTGMPAYNKDSIDHMSVLFMLKAVISVCQYTRCFKKKRLRMNQGAHQARAYLSFCSVKPLGIIISSLPPNLPTPLGMGC